MAQQNKKILSPSWNPDFGNNKSILNKTPILNSVPVNNSYVFFKNGAYSAVKDKQFHDNNKDFKKIYQDDRKSKNSFGGSIQNLYGPLTNRPISFTEKSFSNIYYNSFGANINFGSILSGFINPLTIGALFGIPTETLMGLMICAAIALEMTNAINGAVGSSGSLIIPKMGVSKMFFYEQPVKLAGVDKMLNQVINRIYPMADEKKKKIIYKDMMNLSSGDQFKKNLGKVKDKILCKSQYAGGSGYAFSGYKGIDVGILKTYIKNIQGYANKKDDILKSIFGKDRNYSKYKDAENEFLKSLEDVSGSPLFALSSIPNYIHIDFTDYVVAKFTSSGAGLSMGILSNASDSLLPIVKTGSKYRNMYLNEKKEKSIFGPYICRSKFSWMYYPKIIIQSKGFTTGYTGAGSQIGFLGGLNIFGGIAPVQSIGSYTAMDIALLLLSLCFPLAVGSVGMSKSAETMSPCLSSPPIAFPWK
jgi:hypothetical protein